MRKVPAERGVVGRTKSRGCIPRLRYRFRIPLLHFLRICST